MHVNSSTYLCNVPPLPTTPPEEEEDETTTTSISNTSDEEEDLRATNKGWDLLHPLEGNCMFLVPAHPTLIINSLEHRLVDLYLLS